MRTSRLLKVALLSIAAVSASPAIYAADGAKKAGDKPGGALAERRAAAAKQKAAETAQRVFAKFDTNRDGALSATEWPRAQAALGKMIESDVLKVPAARMKSAKEALAGAEKPDVEMSQGGGVTKEAFEAYATAASLAAGEAVANAAPPPTPEVAAEAPKSAAQRRREEQRNRARNGDVNGEGNGNGGGRREGDNGSSDGDRPREGGDGPRDGQRGPTEGGNRRERERPANRPQGDPSFRPNRPAGDQGRPAAEGKPRIPAKTRAK